MKIQDLDTPEGLEMIRKAKTDNEVVEEILKKLESYFAYIVRGFTNKNYEDYMQEARFAFLRAIRNFDFDRGAKFTSYSIQSIRNALIRYSTALDKNFAVDYRKKIDLNLTEVNWEKIESMIDGESWLEEVLESEELENILNLLDEREKFVLKSVYGIYEEPKRTYDEIGFILNVSGTRAGQIMCEIRWKIKRSMGTCQKQKISV